MQNFFCALFRSAIPYFLPAQITATANGSYQTRIIETLCLLPLLFLALSFFGLVLLIFDVSLRVTSCLGNFPT